MLEDKISGYLDLIAKAASKAGPQVMKFAVAQEYWSGIGDIIIGFFFLIVALIGIVLFFRYLKDLRDMVEPGGPIALVGGIGGIVSLVVSGLNLLDIWNWVAVFNPRIALFHDILNRFLDH